MPRKILAIDNEKIERLCAALVGTKYESKISLIRQQQCCPVIENTANEDIKEVTFFYMGDGSEGEQVNICSYGFASELLDPEGESSTPKQRRMPIMPIPKFLMNRLDGTNVWVLSRDIPKETLISYYVATQSDTSICDPLNPRGFSTETLLSSVLDLSMPLNQQQLIEERRAVEQHQMTMEDIRGHGRLKRYSISYDGNLTRRYDEHVPEENERMLTVHLPQDYAKTKTYPMRLFLEGRWYLDGIEVPAILDDGTINIMLEPKVAHGDPTKDRNYEYDIYPDLSTVKENLRPGFNIERFTEFLANQFMPAVRDKFHVSENAGDVTVCGSSQSGFAAMYIGLNRPDVFGNVLTQSAALWLDEAKNEGRLLEQLEAEALQNSCFYLETSKIEAPVIFSSNLEFDNAMTQQGIHHIPVVITCGEHGPAAWSKTLPEAVSKLQEMRRRLNLSLQHASLKAPRSVEKARQIMTQIPPSIFMDDSMQGQTLSQLMERKKVSNVGFAVVKDGELDCDSGVLTTGRVFQTASLAKPITAYATLKILAENGISLDETIDDHLALRERQDSSEFLIEQFDDLEFLNRFKGHGITFRQLLCHTSGIIDPTPPEFGDRPDDARLFLELSQLHESGKCHYSNTGFILLECMLEKLVGKPFPEIMDEKVLSPLEMSESTFSQSEALIKETFGDVDDLIPGERGGVIIDPFYQYPRAAGGLRTTTRDYAKFMQELIRIYHEEPENPVYQLFVKQSALDEEGKPIECGLCVGIHGEGEGLCLMHDGANGGFRTRMKIYPHQKNAAVVMADHFPKGGFFLYVVMRSIESAYGLPSQTSSIEAHPVPEAKQAPYIGNYEFSFGDGLVKMQVIVEDGVLKFKAPWPTPDSLLQKFPVYFEGNDEDNIIVYHSGIKEETLKINIDAEKNATMVIDGCHSLTGKFVEADEAHLHDLQV